MKNDLALILYYTSNNRWSLNAIVGSLETDVYLEDLKIYFVQKPKDLFPNITKATSKHNKVLVGFSFCSPEFFEMKKLIENLKNKFSNDKIIFIAGGAHPTGDYKSTLKMGFDIVVRGEGEVTIRELLKTIDQGKKLQDVKGLAYCSNENFVFNGFRQQINLDDYPPFGIKHGKVGHIEITRGCPWTCYFCQTPFMFGKNVRHRSIQSICKYVKILKKMNMTDIRFITPNVLSYGSIGGKIVNLNALTNLLLSIRKIIGTDGRIFFGTFPSEVRPEMVSKETIELIKNYADNDNLIIGAQSGSRKILDLCHRGHTVDDIYESVRLTIEAGLIANVDFVFGLPGETEKDMELTLNVMDDLIEMGARIHGHTFMPLPMTPYRFASPGKLDPRIKSKLNKLTSKGKLYGDWEKQERIATEIAKIYYRNESKFVE